MEWLTDLVRGKDPVNPQGMVTDSYLSQAPFFNQTPKLNTHMQPAHQNIAEGLQKTFGSGSSVMDRVIGGPLQALGGVFGLPQEGLTLALTGGQHGVPSEVPGVQKIFGDTPLGAFAADVALDPLNLLALPALQKVFKGKVLGQQLASRLEKGLNAVRTDAAFHFPKPDDLLKVEDAIGMQGGIRFDADSGNYTWRFDQMPEDRRIEFQKRASEYLQGNKDESWTIGPPAWKPDNLRAQRALENPMHPVEAQVQKFGGVEAVQTPSHFSEAANLSTNLMTDADKAYNHTGHAIKDQLTELLEDHFDNAPLTRALTHDLFDPTGARGFFETDKAAARAKELFPEYDGLFGAFQKTVGETVVTRLGHQKAWNDKNIPQTIKEFVEENMLADDSTINLPPDFLTRLHSGKAAFGKEPKFLYDPNNANIGDFINSFANTVAKDAHKRPVQQAIENAIKTDGIWGNITKTENDLIKRLLDGWMGGNTTIDDSWAKTVVNNKETLMNLALGKKLYAEVKSGETNLQDLPGIRGILGRKAQDLVVGAERGRPVATQLSGAVRSHIHTTMLGLAVDSSVKSLTQLMNGITEFGMGRMLEGVGADLGNPHIREMMKAENIIDNGTFLMEDVLESTKHPGGNPKKSLKDWIMSPFRIAEEFTRGATATAALMEYSERMPLIQAADAAAAVTKDLMFGYGATDLSPFWRNPILRPIMQFNTYPIKQIELLTSWAKQGHFIPELDEAGKVVGGKWESAGFNLRNKAIRYMINLGGIVGYADHIGLDAKQIFADGLWPGYLFGGSLAESPVGQLVGGTANLGSSVVNYLAGGPSEDNIQRPSQFWKGIGQLISLTVPAGRYGEKLGKNIFESAAFWSPLVGADWNTRQLISEHPYFSSMLKVNPDPGINGLDRFASLIGFKSKHDTNRHELMNMLTGFTDLYRDAKQALNEAALSGGNVDEVRDRYFSNIMNTYGGVFARYGVPTDSIRMSLQPASQAYLEKYNIRMEKPVEQRKIDRLPKGTNFQVPEF